MLCPYPETSSADTEKEQTFTIALVSSDQKTYLSLLDTFMTMDKLNIFTFPEENAHTKLTIMMQGCFGCC